MSTPYRLKLWNITTLFAYEIPEHNPTGSGSLLGASPNGAPDKGNHKIEPEVWKQSGVCEELYDLLHRFLQASDALWRSTSSTGPSRCKLVLKSVNRNSVSSRYFSSSQVCRVCNSTGQDCHEDANTTAGLGISNADFVFYVSALQSERCHKGLTVAYAAHCQQEAALDRPIAGHANLCPDSISTKPQELQTLLSTGCWTNWVKRVFSSSFFLFFLAFDRVLRKQFHCLPVVWLKCTKSGAHLLSLSSSSLCRTVR